MSAPKGVSVLAELTAEVMESKKTEARKLTPVAGERGHMPLEQAQIPNDTGVFMSNEALHDHAKQLRKFAADAIAIADGLDLLLAEPSTSDAPVEKKLNPAELRLVGEDPAEGPQSDFAKDFAAKAAAAQASAFKPEVELATPTSDEWRCPVHGLAIEKTSTKTNRTFVGCPDCNLFKR